MKRFSANNKKRFTEKQKEIIKALKGFKGSRLAAIKFMKCVDDKYSPSDIMRAYNRASYNKAH
jgi:hypothetical protein